MDATKKKKKWENGLSVVMFEANHPHIIITLETEHEVHEQTCAQHVMQIKHLEEEN